MKYRTVIGAIVLITSTLNPFQMFFAQSRETVRRTREKYEKTHPNKRTYSIDDLFRLLDSAHATMPHAKAVTHEKWQEISGAVFGASDFWERTKELNSADDFTSNYFHNNGNLKRIVLKNILTDMVAFQQFMEEHQEKGFYSVTVWKAGYLKFTMLESREERKGINFIVVPAKRRLFYESKTYKKRMQKNR